MSSRTLRGSSGASRDSLVEKALNDLESVSSRELIRSARALEARYRHDQAGMCRFASVFRSFAFARSRGSDPWLARMELRAAILFADEGVAVRLADASSEPFWRHVREALLAHREAVEACWESVEDAEARTETAV